LVGLTKKTTLKKPLLKTTTARQQGQAQNKKSS